MLTSDVLAVVREAPAAQGKCQNSCDPRMNNLSAWWPSVQGSAIRLPVHCFVPCRLCAEADNVIVDPVYEALRYGTSLAQMSRSSFGSISESPCHEV